MEVPLTFVDFAVTETRFRKHFRVAPPDTWNEQMVPLVEFLEMDSDDREDRFPFVWSVDREGQLSRLLVDSTMVESCQDRQDFWTMLRALGGLGKQELSREEIAAEVRREVVGKITKGLVQLAGGGGGGLAALAESPAAEAALTAAPAADGDYLAPWIETPECTACDECTDLNGKIFVYNSDKKAEIVNPTGGPYKDLVKAAEKCTARIIHPGLPRDRSAKDVDKWIKRGEKFN
jgi:pyruvate-ferredoxin/flavodoxin oxidoreductase